MTIRPRAVRALREARARMRDAAAATHATASAARDERRTTLQEEHQRLEAHLDEASTALAAARTIYDLDAVGELTGVHRLAITDAGVRHDEAIAASDATAHELRARARQLRTAERLVERIEQDRDQRAARDEQRANDDLAGRRR